MDAFGLLDQLRRAPEYQQQIVHVQQIPPRLPAHADLRTPLHPSLQTRVEDLSLWPLYSHQARAVDAARDGSNVIVASPAASGKSLCYHLPVLDCLLDDRSARAAYLFPTKALAQDQLRSLRELARGLPVEAAIYDGDTPSEDRASIKRSARLVVTNPDMLHLGVLPNHKTWSRFFRGLKYVVLDEVHIYRGIFGSHVANLLRRLRRVCAAYGASPTFILSSATIGNPGELAEGLVGMPFTVVEEEGAPRGPKVFALWNPPLLDEGRSARRSPNSEAANLLSALVSRQVRTIAFVRTRRVAELLYVYARDQLAEQAPNLAARISPYRAGYLPEDRRRIERALSDGELLGVTATSALELGIDIGALDATVITGYPGSISSTWQRAGRSGRRGEESLSLLVAQNNPLDQYIMIHPEALFGQPVEHALVSPDNPYVIRPHLLCAAYESPLTEDDQELFGPGYAQDVAHLEQMGLLRRSKVAGPPRWHVSPLVTYPAEMVSIRSTSPHNYVVMDETSGVLLETLGEESAFYQLHPGAVHLHQGQPYLVTRLDLESRTAVVRPTDGAYYTQTRDMTDIGIRRVLASRRTGGAAVYLGGVEVTNHVMGFRMVRPFTEEVIGEEMLDLPPRRFVTVGLWFDIPEEALDEIARGRLDLAGGLHAAEHAAIGVLPLFAMCDRNDIGGVSTPFHPETGRPQIFIYDGHPGGIGIAERGYWVIEELWRATLGTIDACQCGDGCPGCIQSPKCGNNNNPLDKKAAALILSALLGELHPEDD